MPSTQPDDIKRRRGIYLLPNAFTTANLFAGFFAVVQAMNGRFEMAAIAIFLALVFDGMDGRVARLTNTQSAFGEQYDSLADMISFGMAPALVMYVWALQGLGRWGWLAAFIYVVGAALRLARFNTNIGVVDKRTETDEAVTLTRVEIVTRFHVAQNTLRDQAGHLYRSDHMTAWCAHHHGVALVLERGLVERCVEKLACKVFDRKDRALYRSTIRMNIEHVHEHTDLECLAVCVGVVHFFDGHNPPVGGRQHGQFAVRGYAWRVAKELQNE